jgi:hypothetical protein
MHSKYVLVIQLPNFVKRVLKWRKFLRGPYWENYCTQYLQVPCGVRDRIIEYNLSVFPIIIISLFNVPTAGAQAFLMDYPQGERAITHHAGSVRIGGC